MLLPIDPYGVLDAVVADPSYSWSDQFKIADALDQIGMKWKQLAAKGKPGMGGLPRIIMIIPGTAPPIAITFSIAKPTTYPESYAGIYLRDISRVR